MMSAEHETRCWMTHSEFTDGNKMHDVVARGRQSGQSVRTAQILLEHNVVMTRMTQWDNRICLL